MPQPSARARFRHPGPLSNEIMATFVHLISERSSSSRCISPGKGSRLQQFDKSLHMACCVRQPPIRDHRENGRTSSNGVRKARGRPLIHEPRNKKTLAFQPPNRKKSLPPTHQPKQATHFNFLDDNRPSEATAGHEGRQGPRGQEGKRVIGQAYFPHSGTYAR